MKRLWITGLVFLFFLMAASAIIIAASAEFSADFTITGSKKVIASGKVFMKGDKIRQEIKIAGKTNVSIVRLDKKIAWTLLPKYKYLETVIPFDPLNPQLSKNINYEKAVIGNENANGYDCQVVQYTYKDKKYGVILQWVASKLQFPVRIQTKSAKGNITSTVDYQNIKTEVQPDSLFELPAGYQKMNLSLKKTGADN